MTVPEKPVESQFDSIGMPDVMCVCSTDSDMITVYDKDGIREIPAPPASSWLPRDLRNIKRPW